MKACVVKELSGPSGMVYTDIDEVSGDGGKVVIDVRAAGVCFPDLLLTKGEYQLKLTPPFVPGMETAGVVRSAPSDAGFHVGERVSAFGVLGGYAEQIAVPVANVVRSPVELDDAGAVSLLVNYNTMYFALARRAALRPGDTVLVLGAAGGVGTAAVQIAKAMQAGKVIAMVHREGAIDYVASLGADVVLPLTEGWAQQVRDHTYGQGVDIVVDPIGGPTFDDALGVLAIDGKLLLIGGCCTDPQGQPAAGAQYQRGGRRVGRVSQRGSRFGRLVRLGAKPAGLSGAQTASAATLSVVGSTGRVAESGRRRCARQGCARALSACSRFGDTVML